MDEGNSGYISLGLHFSLEKAWWEYTSPEGNTSNPQTRLLLFPEIKVQLWNRRSVSGFQATKAHQGMSQPLPNHQNFPPGDPMKSMAFLTFTWFIASVHGHHPSMYLTTLAS